MSNARFFLTSVVLCEDKLKAAGHTDSRVTPRYTRFKLNISLRKLDSITRRL